MNDMCEAENASEGTESGIDLQAALAMAGGDVGLLRELVDAFHEEVPRLLACLRSAVDEHDSDSLRSTTHQLQGVMRCLHIDLALQQAKQLEFLGEGETDWPVAKELLTELDATISSAMGILDEFLGK